MRSVTPDRTKTSPSKINKGILVRIKLFKAPHIVLPKDISVAVPKYKRAPSAAVKNKDAAIDTPASINKIINKKPIKAFEISIIFVSLFYYYSHFLQNLLQLLFPLLFLLVKFLGYTGQYFFRISHEITTIMHE